MTTTTIDLQKAEARVVPVVFEVRDLGTDKGKFTALQGRAIPYNTMANVGGLFTEEIQPGTFAKSIKEGARGLPLTLFHKDNDLGSHIGISEQWNERATGLDGVWRLDQGEEAQRAAQMANDGFLPYLSVRFLPDPGRSEMQYRGDIPHFIRKSARLVATSLVSTPVYADAAVTMVRSMENVKKPGDPGTPLAKWTAYLEQVKQGPIRG